MVAMRPEFVVFTASLLPSEKQVAKSYTGFLPSIHGVRMGSRVAETVLKDVIDRVRRIGKMEPARVKAELELHANRWQSDHNRRFLEALRPVGG